MFLKLMIAVRRIFSPINYWLARKTIFGRYILPNKWDKVKDKNIEEFSEIINSYPYRSDPFSGKFDFSIQEPDFFFLKKDSARDCDDFARIWYFYAKHNSNKWYGFEIWVYEKGNKVPTSHMTAVLQNVETGKFHLADYRFDPTPHDSIQEALGKIPEYYSYKVPGNLEHAVYLRS